MATLTTAARPLGQRLFGDEASSLRSFRASTMSPLPPSPKANSLKTRKSMLPGILGSSRNASSRLGQELTQDMQNQENHVDAIHSVNAPASSCPPAKIAGTEKQADSSPLQRPRSKSRTILRLITTKLNPRSANPPSPQPLQNRLPNRLPAVNSNFVSKDSREAALRERGLLPPLRPNKDLSKQEREQDLQLPVVQTSAPVDKPESDEVSAANLIKKEWEAKNRNAECEQRQRMNSFRFGGTSPSTANSPVEAQPTSGPDATTSAPLDAVGSLPAESSSDSTAASGAPPPPPKSKRYSVPPAIIIKSSKSPEFSPETPAKGPLSPSLIPLPASPPPLSPRRTTDNNAASLISPALLPLPPSPAKTLPETPKSARSTVSTAGNRTPTPQTVRSDVTVTPTAQLPAISFTPASASAERERVSSEESPRSATRKRAGSIPTQPSLSGSISSTMTPSLEASSSQSTGLSSPITPESSPILGRGRSGSVKTNGQGGNIPMIVESPVEEGYLSRFGDESFAPEELAVIAEEDVSGARPKARGLTEPLPKLEKRKTLNPFKRGQTLQAPISPDGQTPKRLSVSASLSNLRRSVVGTVSRPKSTVEVGANPKMFNVSHLPPSPTSPTSTRFSDRSSNTAPSVTSSRSGATTGVGRRPRQAVQPTLHSRGSILLETAAIEDEESRRMTELAFLG